MHKYIGLIGKNINYSISPLIHEYWFKTYGIKAFYNKLDISNNVLNKRYIKKLLNDHYIGFNITIPYKETITHLFNTDDKIVNDIKAANTLYTRNNQGYLCNTDYLGFIISLIMQKNTDNFFTNNEININKILQKFSLADVSKKLNIFNKSVNALILGAGGATRAVLFSLIRSNINKIFLLNRSVNKALQICRLFDNGRISVIKDLNEINNVTLVVNCTPSESKIFFNKDYSYLLEKECLFFDLTYNPLNTEFLIKAGEEGYNISNGLLMLIIQAAFSFKKWFNFFPTINKYLIELTKEQLN